MNKIRALFNASTKSTTSEKNIRTNYQSEKQSLSEKGQSQTSSMISEHSSLTKSGLSQSLSNQGQIKVVSSSLESNPKSLWQSFCNRVSSLFSPIYWLVYVVISIVCTPIYMFGRLFKSFYGLIKPLLTKILQVLQTSIQWIFKMTQKSITYVGQNPIVIVNFVKPVFSSIFSFISFLLNKIKSLVRNQHEKGWPIFNLIRELDNQETLNENDYDILLQQLKQQIQSLQLTKSQIGKDIIQLEQTTFDLINKKEKQIQIKNNQIENLKQENEQVQIKYANERQRVQQLEFQKIKYEKCIQTQQQNMKLTLQETENRHKQDIIQQKQYYQAQFMNMRQQKQMLRQKLQQKIQILKQSFQQLITKKDRKINDYLAEINQHKQEIMNLKEQLHRVIKQHEKQIKQLIQSQQQYIKRSVNKRDSHTQTVQIIDHQHQNQIMFHPQLLKRSSIQSQESQSIIKPYNSEHDFKLGKTKTSIGENYQSQRKTHSNDQIPNYMTFSNRFNDSKRINIERNLNSSSSSQSSVKKINSSIKIISDFPQKQAQQLNISHTIYMNLSDVQSSKKCYSEQEIQVKSNNSSNNNNEQKQKNNFCFGFFMSFICLWSIYMCHKLHELWNLLQA